jgi:hypothetical protein
MVWKLDRLARSLRDLITTLDDFCDRGIKFRSLTKAIDTETPMTAISTLDEQMGAAGARFFVGGLKSAPHAKSLRKQPGGEVVITDGPYLETREHTNSRTRRLK